MANPLRTLIIKLLRIPPEPDNPMGDYESLRVFRASEKFFQYKLLKWIISQGFAIAGAIAGLIFLRATVITKIDNETVRMWLYGAEIVGFLFVIIQAIYSFMMLKLDYELRWYKVTDRSLRIREGVWMIREMTMTFANIQNTSINQGPIQRMLGIADVKVETAGGGGAVADPHGENPMMLNMHTGYFRGVDNAEEIRDLIRARMRHVQDSGLGDLDERQQHHDDDESHATRQRSVSIGIGPEAMQALRQMRDEAVALRAATEHLAQRPHAS